MERVSQALDLMKKKKWEEAVGVWEEVRKKDKTIAPAYIQAGVALRMLKRYDEALELFDASIKLHPQAVNNLIQKAATLMELQKWEEAVAVWEEVRKKDNTIAPAYIQEEHALINLGQKNKIPIMYIELISTVMNDIKFSTKDFDSLNECINLELDKLFLQLYTVDEFEDTHNIFDIENVNIILVNYINRYYKDSVSMSVNALEYSQGINYSPTIIQDDIIRNKRISVKSPTNNQKYISSDKSIIINDFIYAFAFVEEDRPMFLFFNKHVPEPVFWFLPLSKQVFLIRKDEPYKESIIKLINHSVKMMNEIKQYMKCSPNGSIAWIRNGHVGHHLWNDLSAIERIFSKKIHSHLSSIVVVNHRKTEIYGKLEEIYQLKDLQVNRTIDDSYELAKYIYQNNYIATRLGDRYISKSLVQRLRNFIDTKYDQLEGMLKFKLDTNNSLKVLLGLRFENRTWINQREGLESIINYILKNFNGHVIIFIDGHNSSASGNYIKSHMEKAENNINKLELDLCKYLQEAITESSVDIISLVGSNILENLYVIDKIDFFIAPWGAGLAKYQWFSNKEGIVFTSNFNMENKPDINIYNDNKIREDAQKSLFVDKRFVRDIFDEESHILGTEQDEYRANFYVDPQGIFEKIGILLEKYENKETL